MTSFGLVPFRRTNRTASPYGLVDSFFNDDFFRSFFADNQGLSRMSVDVKDEKDKYVLEAEIPGAKKEDIKLDIDDGVLTLSAEIGNEKNEEKDNYVYRERRYGSVCRSFSLDNIDDSKIKAEYKDGILTVDLPKKEPEKKLTRSIDIK
jgi:HSP20 family protein